MAGVCLAAQHLASKGSADQKRLCIDGGSAGGYTTLACLAFKCATSPSKYHQANTHYVDEDYFLSDPP